MSALCRSILALLVVVNVFSANQLWSAETDPTRTIVSRGLKRSYLLHLPPAYDGVRRLPVVLNFHGGFGRGRTQRRLTAFNAVADAAGVIVVYPNGIRRRWHDDRGIYNPEVDDVGFVSDLIDSLNATYATDPRRVYATGISNGGFLTLSLACKLTDKIAAVAVAAASMPIELMSTCHPRRPISVMMINGTFDWLVPYAGGALPPRAGRGTVVSIEDAFAFWRAADGCGESATVSVLVDPDTTDGTVIAERSYGGCNAGSEVALYTVFGGGHTWPGGWQYLPIRVVGRTSRDMNASQEIWEFFQAQTLP